MPFRAGSSAGTNVNVCTNGDLTKSVDALVYYIALEVRFWRLRTLLALRREHRGWPRHGVLLVALSICNNQGMDDIVYGKVYDFSSPAVLRLFGCPLRNIIDAWHALDHGTANGSLRTCGLCAD